MIVTTSFNQIPQYVKQKELVFFVSDIIDQNLESLAFLYKAAVNNSQSPIMLKPSKNFSVYSLSKLKKDKSIQVSCIGIMFRGIEICNSICMYIKGSVDRCNRLIGLGADPGMTYMSGKYNVIILDEWSEYSSNNSVNADYISTDVNRDYCFPWDHIVSVNVNDVWENMEVRTRECMRDGLLVFAAETLNNSAIIGDTEARVSYFDLLVTDYDRTVSGKTSDWFVMPLTSIVVGEKVRGVYNADQLGRNFVKSGDRNLDYLLLEYSSTTQWIISNYTVNTVAIYPDNGKMSLSNFICYYFKCPYGPLCFNVRCDKNDSWSISARARLGVNMCSEAKYVKQDRLSVQSITHGVHSVVSAGMRPHTIMYNGKIVVVNGINCSAVEYYGDYFNFSASGEYVLSYVGYEIQYVVFEKVKQKREIQPVFHESYSQNDIWYFWWAGFPINRDTMYMNKKRYSYGYFIYEDAPGVVAKMREDGAFDDGRENNMILLVHGWHAMQSSEDLFKKVLRHHQKMTPNSVVLYVKWEFQGANDIELGNAAYSAVRVNLQYMLQELPNKTNLHCVGHSLGGHACAAICRHYRTFKGRNCTRIVSLDPASKMFYRNSPWADKVAKYRIDRSDADYVAVLMTNRNLMGLDDFVGDEYLMTNAENGAYYHEGCPLVGKWWGKVCTVSYNNFTWCDIYDVKTLFNSAIIPHTIDSCSHMMAPIQFVKFLDIYNPAPIATVSSMGGKAAVEFRPSSWSSYVTSLDKRYNSDEAVWASFRVDEYTSNSLIPLEIVTFVIGKYDWEPKIVNCPAMHCIVYKKVKVCKYFVRGDYIRRGGLKIGVYTGFQRVPYVARIRRADGLLPINDWSNDLIKSKNFWQEISSTEVQLHCKNSYYDKFCYHTPYSIQIPASRSMLPVNGHQVNFSSCMVNDTKDLPDLKIHNPHWVACNSTIPCEFDAVTLRTEYSSVQFDVIKIWDDHYNGWFILYHYGFMCTDNYHIANLSVQKDWTFDITFAKPGNKLVHVVYPFDKVEIIVYVYDLPSLLIKWGIVTTKATSTTQYTTTQFTTTQATAHPSTYYQHTSSLDDQSTTGTTTSHTDQYTNTSALTSQSMYSSSGSVSTSLSVTSTQLSDSSDKVESSSIPSSEDSTEEAYGTESPTSDTNEYVMLSESTDIPVSNSVDEGKVDFLSASSSSNMSLFIGIVIVVMVLVAAVIIAYMKYRHPKKNMTVVIAPKDRVSEEMIPFEIADN